MMPVEARYLPIARICLNSCTLDWRPSQIKGLGGVYGSRGTSHAKIATQGELRGTFVVAFGWLPYNTVLCPVDNKSLGTNNVGSGCLVSRLGRDFCLLISWGSFRLIIAYMGPVCILVLLHGRYGDRSTMWRNMIASIQLRHDKHRSSNGAAAPTFFKPQRYLVLEYWLYCMHWDIKLNVSRLNQAWVCFTPWCSIYSDIIEVLTLKCAQYSRHMTHRRPQARTEWEFDTWKSVETSF